MVYNLKIISIAVAVIFVILLFGISILQTEAELTPFTKEAENKDRWECNNIKDFFIEYDYANRSYLFYEETFHLNEKIYTVIQPSTGENSKTKLVIDPDCRLVEDLSELEKSLAGHIISYDERSSELVSHYHKVLTCFYTEEVMKKTCDKLRSSNDFIEHPTNQFLAEHGYVIPPIMKKLEPYGWSKTATRATGIYIGSIDFIYEGKIVLEVAEDTTCFLGETDGSRKYQYTMAVSTMAINAVKNRETFSDMHSVWADLNEVYLESVGTNDTVTKIIAWAIEFKGDPECRLFLDKKGKTYNGLVTGTTYLRNIESEASREGENTHYYLNGVREEAHAAILNASSIEKRDWSMILLSGEYHNKEYSASSKLDEAKYFFGQQKYISAKRAAISSSEGFSKLEGIDLDLVEAIFRFMGVVALFILFLLFCFWVIIHIAG